MKRRGRKVLVTAAAAMVACGAIGAVAWGLFTNVIVAEDDQYPNPNPFSQEGTLLGFDNNGPDHPHTATADDDGAWKGPLFDTGIVQPGQNDRPVNGTQFLEAGQYDFHCEVHSVMQGTLTVSDSPSGPEERPRIELKVKSKKLEKVVASEKLKVEVTSEGPTDAENISLKAKKGSKKIATGTLDVGAGKGDTEKLKLTKKGEKKLDDLEKAKVIVKGTVEFGFGDKAKKKLK